MHVPGPVRARAPENQSGVALSELNRDRGCFPSRMLREMEIEGSEQGRDKSGASQRAEGSG